MPKLPPMNSHARREDVTAPSGPGPRLRTAYHLPLAVISPNPHQPRQVFDAQADTELTASIAADGVIEPIVVRPHPDQEGRFLLVAGERRWRAAQAAGLADIPALVREDLDETAAYFLTVQENLQRAGLDIEDEARQFQTLQQMTGLSQRELARRLGVGFNYLSRRVRLLERPELLGAYREGLLTLHQALDYVSTAQAYPPEEAAVVYPADTRDDGVVAESQERPVYPADTRDSSVVEKEDGTEGLYPQDKRDSSAVERATLDHRTGAVRGGDLQRTPWRDRPLSSFMDWVARVDVTTVPPQALSTTLDQIAEARNWLTRLELQLQERKNRESA